MAIFTGLMLEPHWPRAFSFYIVLAPVLALWCFARARMSEKPRTRTARYPTLDWFGESTFHFQFVDRRSCHIEQFAKFGELYQLFCRVFG